MIYNRLNIYFKNKRNELKNADIDSVRNETIAFNLKGIYFKNLDTCLDIQNLFFFFKLN